VKKATAASGHEFGNPWTIHWPTTSFAVPTVRFAPEKLWQPINDGWTFGNIIVNEQNSPSPNVERAISQQVSYGRQIGRISEALMALIDAAPTFMKPQDAEKFRASTPITDFVELSKLVQTTKSAAAKDELQQLLHSLESLKKQFPEAWKQVFNC
jgi:hypothetical protein